MSKLTPQEAIDYIENHLWNRTRLGLERTRTLLRGIDDPQKKLKFIHVAGSNGKGSTCAMLASILKEAGYKVGLFISPYIQVFNERIQINGENIPDNRLAEITTRVKEVADAMDDHPSHFELVTAIGFQYFLEEECDIVVLEVGMGGELDSTNAIDAPEVAVLTNIGLEHTEYLGDTLEKIATTKAGIIKKGTSVVCYDSVPEVINTIRKICAEKNVPMRVADMANIVPISSDIDGQVFRFLRKSISTTMGIVTVGRNMVKETEETYRLPLLGNHQLHNAAVVLKAVDVLNEKGWKIPDESIRKGLANVSWPARFEVLSKDPVFVLDGGHNPQCAEALTASLEEYFPGEKIVFLLGVLADKDYKNIVDMMIPYAREFVCVTPISNRALPAEELVEYIKSKGVEAVAVGKISKGIAMAIEKGDAENASADAETAGGKSGADAKDAPIVAFGSLYLAGTVRTEFSKVYKKYIRRECIAAREELTEEEREDKSEEIVKMIMDMPEYREAKLVMLYKWTNAEVRLDELEEENADDDSPKAFAYPLCEGQEMKAILPDAEYGAQLRNTADIIEEAHNEEEERAKEEQRAQESDEWNEDGVRDSRKDDERKNRNEEDEIPDGWRVGSYGILEPTKGFIARPEEIDLVICPCTGFDENLNRLGMGGGFYDRFLPLCKNAKKIAIAFEAQKIPRVRVNPHDIPMDAIVTEEKVYRGDN